MSKMNGKPRPTPTSDGDEAAKRKVADGPEGMRRMEDLLRRILKVPKDRIQEAADGRSR